MKKILILSAAIFFASCANKAAKVTSVDTAASKTADISEAPILKFENDKFDFGQVNAGEKVSHDYKFTNTGKTPLIITNALASCGCTVPEYPKEPIAPGKDGLIKVVFNSAGKFGQQTKAITITSNAAPPTTTVYLSGEVKELKQTK